VTYPNSPIHRDRVLANFAVAYENFDLIADKLSPIVPTDEISGTYFKRNKESFALYTGQQVIGPSSDVPETEGDVTEGTFACKGRGRMSKIPLQTDAQADIPLTLRQDAVMDAMSLLMLEREVRIATQLTTSGNFAAANTATVGTKWDSTGNPLVDIDALRGNIWRAGNTRLVAYCGWDVWKGIKNNTNVLARINGGATTAAPALVLRQAFAELIEVDELVVGQAWYLPSVGGTQARVWGKDFGIVAVSNSPSTRSLSFAQTMRWTAIGPGGVRHEQWIDPSKGTMGVERHKITMSDDEIIPANDAGLLLKAAVT